jgi:hypothetical protein
MHALCLYTALLHCLHGMLLITISQPTFIFVIVHFSFQSFCKIVWHLNDFKGKCCQLNVLNLIKTYNFIQIILNLKQYEKSIDFKIRAANYLSMPV